MPFIDFNDSADTVITAGYDVTIVGAGAAGIFLATGLSKGGKKVLLLESGHFTETNEKQSLNEVKQTGKFLYNAEWGRKRVIGGTTISWGGQSLPFSRIDLQKREWVNNSGWPIVYDELAPFYKEANEFMGIDTYNYHEEIFDRIKIKPPSFDAGLLDYHISKWAQEPNFYKLYGETLKKDVTVLFNAQLVKVCKDSAGNASSIVISNFSKRQLSIAPGILIIAAGGIESVRLLLTNDIVDAGSKKWLGKCFMDHPCIEVGDVLPANDYKFQQLFNTHVWKQRKYSVRLSLSEKAQEKYKLLNCSASLLFRPAESSFDPYGELKMFTKDRKVKRLYKIAASGRPLLKSALALLSKNFYYKQGTVAKLILMTEQEPITESCISLSSDTDIFGVPMAVINWKISEKTWQTVVKITGMVAGEFERLQLGTVKKFKHVTEENKNWQDHLTDVNHHMGGARMSDAGGNGVVDKDLKLWGTQNMYVCSCAVFPTVSHSNPTLTMLALAARLKKQLLEN